MILSACDKETSTAIKSQKLQSSEELANDIISFRDQILYPDKRKSAEIITLDSSINIMEASFNFHHCIYNKDYSEVYYDSVIIPIQTDSALNLNQVKTLYITINNGLYEIFENCSFQNKMIKYIDLYADTNDNLSFIKGFIAIGRINNTKACSTPIVMPTVTSDNLWAGATPFNNQQGECWELANNHNNTNYANGYYVRKFFTDTEVAIAINNIITLPYENSNVYIYLVNTVSIKNYDLPLSYASIYEYDPDIAGPDEVDKEYPHFLFQRYGTYNESTSEWRYQSTKTNYTLTPETNYRFMNKYYNICIAAVEYYKPNHKEAIDLTFGTYIIDAVDNPSSRRDLSAKINITYAKDSPYLDERLTKLTFIN